MTTRTLIPLLLTLPLLGACTTLGPMPSMTMNSPIPSKRATFEMTGGLAPGFFLSQAAQSTSDGTAMAQSSVLLDIGKWTELEGLHIGGRLVDGGSGPLLGEPMIGYRMHLDEGERFSLGLTAFGSHSEGAADGASHEAIRFGLEAVVDARLTPPFPWIELHAQMGLSATGVLATGSYCVNDSGWGITCGERESSNQRVSGELQGLQPAAFTGITLDLFQGFPMFFHGIRAGVFYAAGSMPTLRHGKQSEDHLWHMFGAQLSVAVGGRE